jgi:hypothetical protein
MFPTSAAKDPVLTKKLILEDIDRFLADRAVQRAIDASRDSSPLQICYPTEVPLSRFLAWLFDPTQGHCLNGAALRALLAACWESGLPPALSQRMRDRIAPTALAQLNMADVIIEREVVLDHDAGRLDVLMLLPGQKLLIAIENKTGARQAYDQLERYRSGLKSRFKGWEQLLVFLDLYGAEPNDEHWAALQYDWLIDELRVAEESTWLGEEPRHSITEFRKTLARLAGEDAVGGIQDESLLAIITDHQRVFRQMGKWIRDPQPITSLASQIYRNGASADLALQALFPVFARRINLWRRCIPMVDYAMLRVAAQGQFDDLMWDPKHTGTAYFALSRWERLRDAESRYWPFSVCVWENFEAPASERFVIASEFFRRYVADEYKAGLQPIVKALRAQHRHAGTDLGQSRTALRVSRCESRESAAAALCEHLKELEVALDT